MNVIVTIATVLFSDVKHCLRPIWEVLCVKQELIHPNWCDTAPSHGWDQNLTDIYLTKQKWLIFYHGLKQTKLPAWTKYQTDFATTLAPPVCAIFNSSLREGTVPLLWKWADTKDHYPKCNHRSSFTKTCGHYH